MPNGYYIKSAEFEEMIETMEEIFGNITLIRMFCLERKEVDDFYKIIPIIRRTEKLSDDLSASFTNIRYSKRDI